MPSVNNAIHNVKHSCMSNLRLYYRLKTREFCVVHDKVVVHTYFLNMCSVESTCVLNNNAHNRKLTVQVHDKMVSQWLLCS